MNTVRSCFAAAVAFLVVAIGWWAADAVVCCNSSSVASGGEDRSCWNKNRTFQSIDGSTCDDNRTAVSVRKCCPPRQPYDPEVRFCGPAGVDSDEYLRRMMQRLRGKFRAVADAVMVGYDYTPPTCDATEVLVDVPTVEVRGLMEADPSAVELPPGYCFDLTPSDELVARTCRPRDQYCGRDGYTCVNKCCEGDQEIVFDDEHSTMRCKKSETPFQMTTYETNSDGRPMGRSNSTVLPYNAELACSASDMRIVSSGFMLTTNGTLYRTDKEHLVAETRFCVDYFDVMAGSPEAARVLLVMCNEDTEDRRGSWTHLVIGSSFVTSAVCLVLTLLVYAILSYLRNVHGYYVMFYVACLLVSFVCLMALKWTRKNMEYHSCVLYGYFTLFAILTTFCWLNVICFDIYLMLRYNNTINRNKSKSVSTIMYHIYGWGFSSIWVSTGYFFQHSQHETLLKFAPDIGYRSCWFSDFTGYGTLIFFLLPACVMLTANLILFLLTAIHCSKIKSELNKFKQTDDSKAQTFLVDKEKFVMSIKLFLVMGIPYLFSILSILFQSESFIWDIMDAINRLQGVLLFYIFVAKRKVIMDIRKKFRGLMDHSKSTQIDTITVSS